MVDDLRSRTVDEVVSDEQIDVLLTAAIAAPCMHHTRQWRFELNDHVIAVFLDGSRALPAEDPTGRALRIAAGAATFNLRCAAASLGYHTWLGLAPCPDEPDLVARIVLEPAGTNDQELRALALQIRRRHTYHTPVQDFSLPQDIRIALLQAALKEKAELTFEQYSAIAVLSTEQDGPADQLTAGLALERVLLTATREGLTASFLNHPLEYADLRRAAQRTTGKPGFAQLVIQFGPGHPATNTTSVVDPGGRS